MDEKEKAEALVQHRLGNGGLRSWEADALEREGFRVEAETHTMGGADGQGHWHDTRVRHVTVTAPSGQKYHGSQRQR